VLAATKMLGMRIRIAPNT